MAIKLNIEGLKNAQKLIQEGEVEHMGTWQEYQATQDEINHFLNTHTTQEYGLWFLGIDTNVENNDRHHYVFPYGDLKLVQKSGLEASIKEAKAQGHNEIVDAAKKLLDTIGKK